MSFYDLLLGDPTDQARMAEAARQLRRQETLGTVAALSGDPVMQPFGTAQLAQAQKRGEGLRRAREQSTTARALGEGYFEQGGDIKRLPGYQESQRAKEERALQRAIQAAEARGRASTQEFLAREDYRRGIIPESTWRGAKGVAGGLTQIEALAALVEPMEASPDIAQPGKDVVAGQLTDLGAGGLVRMVEPMYRGLNARQLRSQLENILTGIRNSAFGAALTKYEGGRYEQVSPTAPGLEKEDMIQRTKNLLDYLRREANTLVAGRRSPSGEPMPAFLEEGFPWSPTSTPSAPAAPSPAPGLPPEQVQDINQRLRGPSVRLPPGWKYEGTE